MPEFKYLVFQKHKDKPDELKAGFVNSLDAMQYRDFMNNISISAGYGRDYYMQEKEG